MDASRQAVLRRLILAIDGILILAAMVLAYLAHGVLRASGGPFRDLLKAPPRFEAYAALAYLILPLWLSLIALLGLHRFQERRWGQLDLLWGLLKLHGLGLAALSVVAFLTQTLINRSLVAMLLAATFLLLWAERSILGVWLRYLHGSGQGRERLLLVGAPGAAMHGYLAAAGTAPYPPEVVGFLAAGPPSNEPSLAGPHRLGDLADLDRLLHDEAIDVVVFLPPVHQPEAVPEAVASCEELGVKAYFSLDLERLSRAQPRVIEHHGSPFIALEGPPKSSLGLAIKHASDLALAAAALVLLSPLLLAAGLAILLTMGRPIFFTQERVGLYGRRFRMVKLRTMVRGAEARRGELSAANEMDGPVFKLARDPRVTPLGRWLRKTSIDELPQLWNVLSGEMSLVGPRPLPVAEQQQIRGGQRRRLAMRPGLTGLWQVSGRNEVDFERWMELDLLYVDRWSLGLDFKVLLRTVPALLSGRGAR